MACCSKKLFIGCAGSCEPFYFGFSAEQAGLHVIEVIDNNYIDKYNVSYELGQEFVIPSDFSEVGITTVRIKQPDGTYYVRTFEGINYDCFQLETKTSGNCLNVNLSTAGSNFPSYDTSNVIKFDKHYVKNNDDSPITDFTGWTQDFTNAKRGAKVKIFIDLFSIPDPFANWNYSEVPDFTANELCLLILEYERYDDVAEEHIVRSYVRTEAIEGGGGPSLP